MNFAHRILNTVSFYLYGQWKSDSISNEKLLTFTKRMYFEAECIMAVNITVREMDEL